MKTILAALTVFSSICFPAHARQNSRTTKETIDKPNFVIIFTDDQGYSDLGCFGSKANRAPHLDRLAAEGRTIHTTFPSRPSIERYP